MKVIVEIVYDDLQQISPNLNRSEQLFFFNILNHFNQYNYNQISTITLQCPSRNKQWNRLQTQVKVFLSKGIENYEEVINKIQLILKNNSKIQQQPLANIVKSIFYGLWNFDKMINQHNLSTKISNMLHQIPFKTAISFLVTMLKYLVQKWEYIDHHRINKFMQLVRYLIREGFRISKNLNIINSEIDQVLKQTVFANLDQRLGLVYHVVQIYYQTLNQVLQSLQKTIDSNYLNLFVFLLKNHRVQHFRLHLIKYIYAKHKQITNNHDLNELIAIITKLATQEQKDLYRRNLYTLLGFLKSSDSDFEMYIQHKLEKKTNHDKLFPKKKKVISKQKKQEIKIMKNKKKQQKKKNKKSKIMSIKKNQHKSTINTPPIF